MKRGDVVNSLLELAAESLLEAGSTANAREFHAYWRSGEDVDRRLRQFEADQCHAAGTLLAAVNHINGVSPE